MPQSPNWSKRWTVDAVVPVDIHIRGCPLAPMAILAALLAVLKT